MSADLETPKMFTLKQLALHEVTKKLWNTLVSRKLEDIDVPSFRLIHSNYFSKYRDRVLTILPDILPAVLKSILFDGMIKMRLGCSEAYDWIFQRQGSLQLFERINDGNVLKLKLRELLFSSHNDGKYEAIRFIDPSGHFDELSWAMFFVTDENQPLKCRFLLACQYCFEEEINKLWNTMKDNNQLFCEDDFNRTRSAESDLIKLWISFLENESHNFHVSGFHDAFDYHMERAAIFFFQRCSDHEKVSILSELDFTDLCTAAVQYNCVRLVQFIYSSLSMELKYSFLSHAISILNGPYFFLSMFLSPYYKSFLSDILTFSHLLDAGFYKVILTSLADVIKNTSVPAQKDVLLNKISVPTKEVFKVLWNHLSQDERHQILSSSEILHLLILIDHIDLFETVILPMSPSMKYDMLVCDSKNHTLAVGCPRVLYRKMSNTNCEVFDAARFLRYLFFYILDYDTESQRLTIRYEAWHRFLEYEMYSSISNVSIYNEIISRFEETLSVLDELANQMNPSLSFKDFLRKEVYPRLNDL